MKADSPGTVKKFLEYAKPDEAGHTGVISIEELNRHYKTEEFTCTNGGGWCRSDGALSKYNVNRIKGPSVNAQGKSVRTIVAVQLEGFKASTENRSIRGDIKKAMRARKCAVLQTANQIQVDHKCPRLELTPKVWKPETQSIDDFQALCQTANSAKRGHCQDCKNSGQRFDAKVLGYSVAQWTGGSKWANSCVGCYWYDPVEFNAQVSKGFKAVTTKK